MEESTDWKIRYSRLKAGIRDLTDENNERSGFYYVFNPDDAEVLNEMIERVIAHVEARND